MATSGVRGRVGTFGDTWSWARVVGDGGVDSACDGDKRHKRHLPRGRTCHRTLSLVGPPLAVTGNCHTPWGWKRQNTSVTRLTLSVRGCHILTHVM